MVGVNSNSYAHDLLAGFVMHNANGGNLSSSDLSDSSEAWRETALVLLVVMSHTLTSDCLSVVFL